MSRFTKRVTSLSLPATSTFVALTALVAIPFGVLTACSSSDDGNGATTDGDDAGGVIPSQDASADAATDADAALLIDADTDAAPPLCSSDHFCHTVLPKGRNLRGVWPDGQGTTWATSVEGDLLRWDGTSWTIHQHLTDEDGAIFSIFGTGPTDIWIPTTLGLLHGTGTSPATLVFAPVTLPGDETVLIKSVWGTGPNDLWAVGGLQSYEPPYATARALHYTGPQPDGGSGWSLDTDLSSRSVFLDAVFGSDGTGVWVYGAESNPAGDLTGVVLRREKGKTTWATVDIPGDPGLPNHPGPAYFGGAALSSDSSVWLTGVSSGDFDPAYWHGTKNASGGFDWTFISRDSWDRPVVGFWGTAPNDTWEVGQAGLVAHWDGSTWTQAVTRVTSAPIAKMFWGIAGTSADDFWVVGDEIALHRTNANKP